MDFKMLTNREHQLLVEALRCDTEALATENGRRVGQPGNKEARSYLIKRMSQIGIIPFKGEDYSLPYKGKLLPDRTPNVFVNIVGVVPGKNPELDPILIGAHYDSVIDAPCADDNATSVALNLAIAEKVMESPLDRDLIVAFYDAEEPPYFQTDQMGSTRFYEDHCRQIKFSGIIVTDLIGHDFCVDDLMGAMSESFVSNTCGLDKTLFVTGAESDKVFPGIIEKLAPRHEGLKIFPTLNSYTGNMSDHHAFEKAGVPFLFFSCSQGKYYHHELDRTDTPGWINFVKLANATNFIENILYELDLTPAGVSSDKGDTTNFEIRMIKKLVGPTRLKIALKAFGLEPPKNRNDLDKIISYLIGGIV